MRKAQVDEFAFVLIAGVIIIIVLLLTWGVPSGEQIPKVNPDSISLTIGKGRSENVILEINVTSESVTLTPRGTIKDWIELSDDNFESSGLSYVRVTITVPLGAEERRYAGSIDVETLEGGKVSIPVTIDVIKVAEEKIKDVYRTIYLGDVLLTHTEGFRSLKTIESLEIDENSPYSFSVSIEDLSYVTDGKVILYILYTNGEGNLVVKLNNQVIHNGKAMPGELEIPVEKSLLKSYNVIEISTRKPGWKFWTKSIYRIDKVEFGVNYSGLGEEKRNFEVYREEILNFKEGRIEFNVRNIEGPGKLTIKINGNKIYEGRETGRTWRYFNYVDVGLVKGTNTISFSTEASTTYEIEDIKLVIVHETRI